MDKFSYLGNADVTAIEELYNRYLVNPNEVDESWRKFFQGFEFAKANYEETANVPKSAGVVVPDNVQKEFKVIELINAYRSRGHLFTKTNPVRTRRSYSPTLHFSNFGFSESDLETVFHAGAEIGIGPAKLKDIIDTLEAIYCRSIGVEFMYIRDPQKVAWLKSKFDINKNSPSFSVSQKKAILHKLNQAVVFENFLHKKFVGQKRFSLEGGESLIPALNTVVENGAALGIEEFVVGMAHRGRLNVLANIFNKTYENIFSEFEGKEYEDNLFDGDVKYHLGYSCDQVTDSGKKVHLTLAPNPSHLEAVDPVVEGIVRAKVDNYLGDDSKICPILIHGDASIAGQGIVYEIIQMAQLKGYKTGGTVHIVVNNQIGFTTNYIDGRSSTYCTDIGKVTLSPVWHVNGDDVEAVVHAVNQALEYRQTYKQDVFIDLLCYRKYGHNEGDEPRFTQPLLYKAIAKHANPREIYLNELIAQGVITKAEADEMEQSFNQMLQDRLNESKQIEKAKITHFMAQTWDGIGVAKYGDFAHSPSTTGFDKKRLMEIAESITQLPSDKNFFKKIVKLIEDRRAMLKETNQLDWAMGELLAYATLMDEGNPVRVSGQDVERGTFSHRHAVITVEDSEEKYVPLANISPNQAPFYIYNSFLSEYGVLGFEYGYAMASPKSLVIWEAQFGDFHNGAQIIIDQFLSSAEEKWHTQNGLVMLLPHGYEGQGAEHSSARLERFLTLCAENNMQIANCTTPANYFHLLRRQLKWDFRKPLIVFTPKSLLRHPKCVSGLEEMAEGKFQEVIDDAFVNPDEVIKVVFVSGKLYYDLLEKRDEIGAKNVALVRVEQMYPLPENHLYAVIQRYRKEGIRWVWAQEEPQNMGAWSFMLRKFNFVPLECVSLPSSGSPATGSSKMHAKRHGKIVESVFDLGIGLA